MNLPDCPRRLASACVALLLVVLALPATARAAGSPPAPYYSVHLATAGSRDQALAVLKSVAAEPAARAEKRKSGYLARFGAWTERAEAERALERYRGKFKEARVIQIENPVEWLLASGERVAPPGAKAMPALPSAAAVPAAPDEAEFKAAARHLDGEVRRWLERGPARADGYVYGMDVAPLLLYAALRKDGALYAQLYDAALSLIVGGDDAATQGFVLWRHKAGVDPEVSGATEALWMARALWTGHRMLRRADDRALALRIVDGYSRHARGEQAAWRVSKYYAFGTQSYADLSVLPNYHPDFIEETEPLAGGKARGLARRSYTLLQRAVTPSKLLVPLIQPALNEVMPGLGVNLYAPNGMVALDDSCSAAEGALRGVPQLAKNVLEFAAKPGRRNANGRLYAYYHRKDGRTLGDHVLSTTGYACLARLAAATRDKAGVSALKAALLGDMQALADSSRPQTAPLYGAGPLLLTADALGAL